MFTKSLDDNGDDSKYLKHIAVSSYKFPEAKHNNMLKRNFSKLTDFHTCAKNDPLGGI